MGSIFVWVVFAITKRISLIIYNIKNQCWLRSVQFIPERMFLALPGLWTCDPTNLKRSLYHWCDILLYTQPRCRFVLLFISVVNVHSNFYLNKRSRYISPIKRSQVLLMNVTLMTVCEVIKQTHKSPVCGRPVSVTIYRITLSVKRFL